MSTPTPLPPEELAAWQAAIGDVVVPGQVLADKYRLDGLLGAGGMGVVLKAWHLHFEERVAVKLMLSQVGSSTTARARFEREARAAFKLKSEHAARAIDIGFLGTGQPFIVMEFLEGLDLAQLLEQRGPLPVPEAVDYVLQAAEAVAEAHVRRIVHRDLKPDNLFLTKGPDGAACIKVVDFGISKEGGEPDGGDGPSKASLLTAAGTTLGTPAYMAPEQWGAAQSVGPGADIWALGVILHQLVTGQLPFDATTLRELFTAVMTAAPRPLRSFHPGFPEPLERAVLRCLEKDPAARFGSVGELAAAIGPMGSRQAEASVAWITRVERTAAGDSGSLDTSGSNLDASAVAAPAPHVTTGPSTTGPGATGPGATSLGAPLIPAVPAALQPTPQAWQGATVSPQPPSRRTGLWVVVASTVFVLSAGVSLAYHFLSQRSNATGEEAGAAELGPTASASASDDALAPTATETPSETPPAASAVATDSTSSASPSSTARPAPGPTAAAPPKPATKAPPTATSPPKPSAKPAPTVAPDVFHTM